MAASWLATAADYGLRVHNVARSYAQVGVLPLYPVGRAGEGGNLVALLQGLLADVPAGFSGGPKDDDAHKLTLNSG